MANMTYTEAGYQHSSESNLVARVKMTVLTWLECWRSEERRVGKEAAAVASSPSYPPTCSRTSV